MSEQVTIREIYRDPVTTKFGPGTRTTIKVEQYPDVRMSSFSKGTESWQAGDKVMIEITKNGEYTNFKPADAKTNLEARVARIEKHLGLDGAAQAADVVPETQEEFNDFN